MTVTFGKLGRWFLAAAALSAVLTLASILFFHDTAQRALVITFGVLTLVSLAHGVAWTVVQQRMFGSIASLRRVAASGVPAQAAITGVHSTSSQIGAEAVAKLDLTIHGQQVTRRVRIPFNHAAGIKVGRTLPVRVDPEGTHAMIVDWDRFA